ncbi:MAG: hypothetical protein ACOYLH_04785 [Flavobacteriales bacterium]
MNLRPAFILGVVALATLTIVQLGCEQPNSSGNNASGADSNSVSSSGTIKLNGQIISIPSPNQLAILVQKANVPFKPEVLSDLSKRELYLDEYKKSMNLGVYGADLAYLANYGQAQKANDYFDAVGKLAGELEVLEHIDGKLVSRLSNNISQRDSVLKLSGQFFHSADKYLKNSQRADLAGLILFGGWIESLHLAVEAASVSAEVKTRIAEQKHACSSLNNLLKEMNNSAMDPIKKELDMLTSLYNSLESTYEYEKPITDSKEKTTYIRSNSSVKMSDEQMAEIKNRIEVIRTLITQ